MNIKSLLVLAAILTVGNVYSISDDSHIAARGGGGGGRGGGERGMEGGEHGNFNRGDEHQHGKEAAGMGAAHHRGEEQGAVEGFGAGMEAAPAYYAPAPEYYPDPNQQQYYPNN